MNPFVRILIAVGWQVRNKALGDAYMIFVIFFTRAKFLENKIYTEKRQFFVLNL